MAAKRNCRLGAITGQREQPLSGSSRKQNTQCVFHIRMSLPRRVVFPELTQRETNMPLSGTAFFSERFLSKPL